MGDREQPGFGSPAGAGPDKPAPLLQSPLSARLDWMSVMRGVCSLWIVYFHTYSSYMPQPMPATNAQFLVNLYAAYSAPEISWLWKQAAVVHDIFAMMSLHAVGIFIVMSGFGLTRSLLRKGHASEVAWGTWLKTRFWRLYPFFWLAHLIYLFAPFIWRPEPIDWRFLVSLTGVRAWPMESILFYANPSWWFFWLILQLYLAFPLLFAFYRRYGVWWFLVLAVGCSLASRYLILFEWKDWRGMIIGGLFTARLAEFALGMALAELWRRDPGGFSKRLTGWRTFLAGLILYPAGLLCYSSLESYLFVDVLCAAGLFLLLAPVARVIARVGWLTRALSFAGAVSLGTFLLHQPWTITAGLALKGEPWWVFGLAMVALLPAMVVIAWAVETGLHAALQRLRPQKPS